MIRILTISQDIVLLVTTGNQNVTLSMNFDFPRKIRSGYLAAFVLLLFAYALTITSIVQLREQNQWVDHTRQVINKLDLMISYLKDAEIGLRGVIMMKDEKFLYPYYSSRQKVDSVYHLLYTYTEDNVIEKERMKVLGRLIDRKFRVISDQLASLEASRLEMNDSVRLKAFESKGLMDSIRFVAGLMQNREDELLLNRTNKVSESNKIVYAIIIASLLISVLLIVYSLVTFNMETKAKKEATHQAAEYHDQLEKRIRELDVANQELIELRSMEKFIATGRIARIIAHEVRNPLTNIDLSAGHLDTNSLNDSDKKMFLEIIARNSKRINQLISELLSATKFSDLKYEHADVNDLLDETLQDANDRAQLGNVKIERKYTNGIPPVQVDKQRIKIALLNIVVNAIESMSAGEGILLIETHQQQSTTMITIRDNGRGMNNDTLSRIFDPYFTSKTKGNGLGLTNTQNIILNHKGKIQVFSEEGKGTTFVIHLNQA
jgi:signal transduction histidine kinase